MHFWMDFSSDNLFRSVVATVSRQNCSCICSYSRSLAIIHSSQTAETRATSGVSTFTKTAIACPDKFFDCPPGFWSREGQKCCKNRIKYLDSHVPMSEAPEVCVQCQNYCNEVIIEYISYFILISSWCLILCPHVPTCPAFAPQCCFPVPVPWPIPSGRNLTVYACLALSPSKSIVISRIRSMWTTRRATLSTYPAPHQHGKLKQSISFGETFHCTYH